MAIPPVIIVNQDGQIVRVPDEAECVAKGLTLPWDKYEETPGDWQKDWAKTGENSYWCKHVVM